MYEKTRKVRVEKVLVCKNSSTWLSTGTGDQNTTLMPAGTTFVNTGTTAATVNGQSFAAGAVQLAYGQPGFYAYGDGADGTVTRLKNTHMGTSDTGGSTPVMYVAVGRDGSKDRFPLPKKWADVSSPIIGANKIVASAHKADDSEVQAWIVGGLASGGSKLPYADNTIYGLSITFHGRKVDIINGRNNPSIFPEFETPDYTSLGYTETQSRAHLVTNLVTEINSQSRLWPSNDGGANIAALAIDDAGGAGVAISGLSAGDVVEICADANGNPVYLTMTADIVRALKNIDGGGAELAATAKIEAVDTSDPVALSPDRIVLIGLDAEQAHYDLIGTTKTGFTVGLRKGFDPSVVGLIDANSPIENRSIGSKWKLFYDSTQMEFESKHPVMDATPINYLNNIDVDTDYAAYILYHSSIEDATDGLEGSSPQATVLMIEACDDTLKTAIEAVLNPWLQSLNNVQLEGTLTGNDLVIPAC